ncbi:type I restriction-modification system DNA methylase subunit [Kroppenstedtia sanguinis]
MADPEDPDEYLANNIFWVSREARWKNIRDHAKKPEIGRIIDDAMVAIEKDNPSLKNVLPKDYALPDLDKTHWGDHRSFLFSSRRQGESGQGCAGTGL